MKRETIERNLPKWAEALALMKALDVAGFDVVFDIGANAGQYATRLREEVGYEGWIISFEPVPDLRETLEELSDGDEKWIFLPIALSDKTGTAEFNVCRGSQFSSFQNVAGGEGVPGGARVKRVVEVEVDRLENVFARFKTKIGFETPFLKMDTQGHDKAVLLGAGSTIQEFVGFQSEINFTHIYEAVDDYKDTLSFYESLGFSVANLFPNNRGHFPKLFDFDVLMWNNRFL